MIKISLLFFKMQTDPLQFSEVNWIALKKSLAHCIKEDLIHALQKRSEFMDWKATTSLYSKVKSLRSGSGSLEDRETMILSIMATRVMYAFTMSVLSRITLQVQAISKKQLPIIRKTILIRGWAIVTIPF